MDDDQQFCLRWNNHQSTLVAVFDTLLEKGMHVDCTLAAEGQTLRAHKVVLSACSPYFETVLSQQYDKHPIIILKDVKYAELRAMMDYMYRGEVNISQDQLAALLKAAESLQIKGLSDNKPSRPPSRPAPPSAHPAHPAHVAHPPRAPSPKPQARDGSIDSREGSVSPTRRRKKARRLSNEPVILPPPTDNANNADDAPCKEEATRDTVEDLTIDEEASETSVPHSDVVRNFQWHLERSQDELMNSSDGVRESQASKRIPNRKQNLYEKKAFPITRGYFKKYGNDKTKKKNYADNVTQKKKDAHHEAVKEKDASVETDKEKDAERVTEKEKDAERVTEKEKDAIIETEKENNAERVTEKEKDASVDTVKEKDAERVPEKEKDAERVTEKEKDAERVIEKEKDAIVETEKEKDASYEMEKGKGSHSYEMEKEKDEDCEKENKKVADNALKKVENDREKLKKRRREKKKAANVEQKGDNYCETVKKRRKEKKKDPNHETEGEIVCEKPLKRRRQKKNDATYETENKKDADCDIQKTVEIYLETPIKRRRGRPRKSSQEKMIKKSLKVKESNNNYLEDGVSSTDKKHMCSICQKKYYKYRRNQLRHEQYECVSGPLFSCELCQKRYSQKKTLKAHVALKHPLGGITQIKTPKARRTRKHPVGGVPLPITFPKVEPNGTE